MPITLSTPTDGVTIDTRAPTPIRDEWRPPDEDAFVNDHTGEEDDFLADPEIGSLAEALIDTFDIDLMGARMCRGEIEYLWKAEGGDKAGKCVKASGLAKHYAGGPRYIIWLAADHCRGWTLDMIKALLFHQLRHIATDGIRKHEIEAFASELAHFGAWHPEMTPAFVAIQLRLE